MEVVMKYPTQRLKNAKIDIFNEKVIYYFTNYYQWEKIKDLDFDDPKRQCSERIYNLSKKGYKDFYGYFASCITPHFNELGDYNWIVCTVPGHAQITRESNNMDNFLKEVHFPQNIKPVPGIIIRSKIMTEKHSKDYGERTVEKDLESFTGDTRNIFDKNFIIFDDITTSGTSLEAARQFLKRRGANKVVCIALGKTVEDYYYGRDISYLF